jgi:hypothetical protein
MSDDLVKRLKIMALDIEMLEKLAWGSDSALMREAAARIEELEAKLAQQDDLVQAAVAAALTEAAGVARLVRDTGDKAHALGIEENAAAYASAGEVIETRILALITPDAQAALDRVVEAERERGFWLGRSCGGSKAEIDAALAAIRKGGDDA